MIAGLIVIQQPDGKLGNYDVLGYTVIGSMLLAVVMIYYLNKRIQRKMHTQKNI
jgi:hypothetical protein